MRSLMVFAGLVMALSAFGCLNNRMIKTNQQQLETQRAELDQLEHQVAALQSQAPQAPHPEPSGCDKGVMLEASRKGGQRFASSDLSGALNYYRDALTACPDDAQAQWDVGRTYEALGDRNQALLHYRLAANASGPDADPAVVRRARQALGRLGG